MVLLSIIPNTPLRVRAHMRYYDKASYGADANMYERRRSVENEMEGGADEWLTLSRPASLLRVKLPKSSEIIGTAQPASR